MLTLNNLQNGGGSISTFIVASMKAHQHAHRFKNRKNFSKKLENVINKKDTPILLAHVRIFNFAA
jgi:hypothetical protein